MSHSEASSSENQNERPRRWFLEHGIVAIGVGILMAGARLLGIDHILILWAGLAGNTQVQDVVRFVFTDLMPVFLLISGFGLYLLGRGLHIDGDTGTITPVDSWIARICGLLLIGYLAFIVL